MKSIVSGSPIGSLTSVSRGIILDNRSSPLTTDYNQDVQRNAIKGHVVYLARGMNILKGYRDRIREAQGDGYRSDLLQVATD